MANNVFANGREVACKKGSGKSICAFPDVVWTPPDKVPPTPTGVPVPYPNTAMASDTSKGTKKVKISGKEAMLKNSSNFKKSMGDEAGVAQLKGFMTMKNRGKVYFQMWSMDVKFEGKNVVRHFDIATHNHGSQVGNTPPWMYIDTVAIDPAVKKEEQWGHKRGATRHDCGGNHDWQCNVAECPDCWDPQCIPNAQKSQREYQETQAGSGSEKKARFKSDNQAKIAKGDTGAAHENTVADSVSDDDFEAGSYKAHCTRCHMIADLDIVTADSVIEVKSSAKGAKLDQMKERIVPVSNKCFPGKKIKIAVPQSELARLKKKMQEKEWAALSIEAVAF